MHFVGTLLFSADEIHEIVSIYFSGLAYFNAPCDKDFGVSVNDASGLTAAYSIAHEMGHK